MIKNMKKYGYIAFVLCVLAGCASQKQISYLQDVPDDYRQKITQDYDLRIHPDDLLSIMVNSKDPELAQMFNLPMVSYQIANSNTGYAGGQNRVLGYLVDKEGNIDFPQLGVIKVRGMTRAELTKYIKKYMTRNKDEDNKYWLYVPLVVSLKKGKAVDGHESTVKNHDASKRQMTKQEKKRLENRYIKLMQKK